MTGDKAKVKICVPVASLHLNKAEVYAVRDNINAISFTDDGLMHIQYDDETVAIFGYHLIKPAEGEL